MGHNALSFAACLALSFTTAVAFAGDVERGRHIAQDRCAACHIVGRGLRGIVADSPPFEVIGTQLSHWRGEAAILACGGAETFEAVKDPTATTCTGKIVQLGNRIFGVRVGRMRISTIHGIMKV